AQHLLLRRRRRRSTPRELALHDRQPPPQPARGRLARGLDPRDRSLQLALAIVQPRREGRVAVRAQARAQLAIGLVERPRLSARDRNDDQVEAPIVLDDALVLDRKAAV